MNAVCLGSGIKIRVFSAYGDNTIDTSPHDFILHYHHKLRDLCRGLIPISSVSTQLGKQRRSHTELDLNRAIGLVSWTADS